VRLILKYTDKQRGTFIQSLWCSIIHGDHSIYATKNKFRIPRDDNIILLGTNYSENNKSS